MSFMDDLKKYTKRAAETLRSNVVAREKTDDYWGMRQEQQMVAETYYLLRAANYRPENLFMEYYYDKKINGVKKKMKADLIFGNDESAQIVEFKVFWDGDLKADGTLSSAAKQRIRDDYSKLREYSSFSEVGDLALVAAFLGPIELYRPRIFAQSVMSSFRGNTSFNGIREQEIEIIPC